MSATLRLPPVLRASAGGARTIPIEGATLRDALESLFTAHPATREQVVDGEGELQRFVNIYVEGEDVRLREGLDTPVQDGATVILLPAMAGG